MKRILLIIISVLEIIYPLTAQNFGFSDHCHINVNDTYYHFGINRKDAIDATVKVLFRDSVGIPKRSCTGTIVNRDVSDLYSPCKPLPA